jgi:uncharacterized membrane protein YhdT
MSLLELKKKEKEMNVKKELVIFSILFVISSGLYHFLSWKTNPIEHFQALFYHSMPYHPFLYVFIIYVLIVIIRIVINLIKKLFRRK